MTILAIMIAVYAFACFGKMRKIALLYLIMALVNISIYPLFDALDPEKNKDLVNMMYIYGDAEAFLLFLFVISMSPVKRAGVKIFDWLKSIKYKWLLFLLFCHIINHTFNDFYYGFVNDTIIICELSLFVWGSKSVIIRCLEFFKGLLARDLRHANPDRIVS